MVERSKKMENKEKLQHENWSSKSIKYKPDSILKEKLDCLNKHLKNLFQNE